MIKDKTQRLYSIKENHNIFRILSVDGTNTFFNLTVYQNETQQLKAKTVLWYTEFKSILHKVFNQDASTATHIFNRWSPRGGLRSHDLIPLDFFL